MSTLELSPDQPDIATLHRLIKDAFSARGLCRFCRYRADFRGALDRVSDPPSLDDLTDELLRHCEERRLLAKLLEEIRAVNPVQAEAHFPELRSRAPAHPPAGASHPPAGGYSQPLSRGLFALADLVRQDPDARKAVVEFRTHFEDARQHSDELIACKFFHDQLHDLEVHCYTPIGMEADRFPHHDGVVETLSYYERNLQRVTSDLKRFIERTDCAMDEAWWIRYVDSAQESLRGAMKNRDAKLLKDTLRQLRRVVTQQPTRINASLVTTAKALRLEAMVGAMTTLSDILARLDLDLEKLNRFNLAVEALAGLERTLSALVDDHDQWQRLDLELRRIEAVMELDTEELEMSWPDLEGMAVPLHQGRSERWAMDFRTSIDDLDSAIVSRNPRLIRNGFRMFCRNASDRFYHIDTQLGEQCEDLGKVGQPLAFLLEML
jgi:hypothetical protein